MVSKARFIAAEVQNRDGVAAAIFTTSVVHRGVIGSGLTVVLTGVQTIKSMLLARPEDGA